MNKIDYFLNKARKIVNDYRQQYNGVYLMKGSVWDDIRDTAESAADLAGNYFLPGSSLLTDNLVSKGAQSQLNSPLGEIAQIGSGAAGAGVGSSFTGIPESVGGTLESNALQSVGNALSNGLNSAENSVSNLIGGSTASAASNDSDLQNVLNGVASANGTSPSVAPVSTPTAVSASSPNTSILSSIFGPSQDSQFNAVMNGLNNQALNSTAQQIMAANPGMPADLASELAAEQTQISPITAATTGSGASTGAAGAASAAGGSGSNLSNILKLAGAVGPLISALKPTTYPGTQTQTSIQNQLAQQAANQQASSQGFINALNSAPMNRNPISPNINYATYGAGPEQLFYQNVNPAITFPTTNTAPILFKKGGPVQKMASGGLPNIRGLNAGPLSSRGLRGGQNNPIIPGGSQVRMLAQGGQPQNAPIAISVRQPYNPSATAGGPLKFGQRMSPPQQSQQIMQNTMTGHSMPPGSMVDGRQIPGGNGQMMMATGGNVPGGQTDNIDAKLSPGEFVVPADVTSSLGDGDTNAGSAKLLSMMKNVRQHKAKGMVGGKLPPKAKSPLQYMAGGQ